MSTKGKQLAYGFEGGEGYHLDMGREYPEFSYSGLSDPSDVLLRQVPEEEEDEEDVDKDDDDEER